MSKQDDMREVGHWGQAIALSFRFLFVGALAIAGGWLLSNVRQIPPDSQAVVVRLGSVERVAGPGLLIAWPRPIEQVVLVPASARQLQFDVARLVQAQPAPSYTNLSGFEARQDPRVNSGFFLTGDSSVVHLEAKLFYRIIDPVAYMIAAEHVAPALERLFMASAISVISGRDLDTILVARPEIASRAGEAARRERFRSDMMSAINARLNTLAAQGQSIGIEVNRVDLVPSIPLGAKDAFDSVLVVTQEAETGIAAARTSAQLIMQIAQQNRDKTMSAATADAEETVSNATVATASVTALAQNSQDLSHGMLMSRLYYDRIGGILGKAGKVELISPQGGVRLYLPGAAQ